MSAWSKLYTRFTLNTEGSNSLTGIIAAIPDVIPADSDFCLIQAESAPARWLSTGDDPNVDSGNLIAVGDTLIVRRCDYTRIKFCAASGSSTININFMKTG